MTTINEALALHHAGRLAEAERAYLDVLRLQPGQYHALHFLGVLKAQQGDMAASAELIARSLALFGDNPLAAFHLGEALRKLGRIAEAAEQFRCALDAGFAPAAAALASCLMHLGEAKEALAVADRGLEQAPGDSGLLTARGEALAVLDRCGEALAAFDAALAADRGHVAARIGRARIRFGQGAIEQAFADVEAAAAADPAASDPHLARAVFLGDLGRRDEAFGAYQEALARNPSGQDIYYNMGCLLFDCGALEQALAAFDSALAIEPGFVAALYNLAHTLQQLARYDEALAASDAALAADPDSGLAAGKSFYLRARRCDWQDRGERLANLERLVRAGNKVDPFALATAFDDPQLLGDAARAWAQSSGASFAAHPLSQGRLRIAYLSPNFHDHPVAFQTIEVFEAHDRTRFETFAICVAPGKETPIRTRLRGAFAHFLEAGRCSDREIAELIHRHHIDIAVDLAGTTADGRTAALRFRPAPVQAGWLGFPGTLGAPYIDYLIADATEITPEDEGFYAEKIARLPLSYMPRDTATPVSPCPPRRELGLPENGFVFSGFNNVLKFTPELFAVWLRLLAAIDGSVLWLNSQDPIARANLKAAAEQRGVAPDRLVFAERVAERCDHLGRLGAADLFLDTLPYGAHSTASDFLWAGVPVLTVTGRSFASRVAGAMLKGLDLNELIAPDLKAYEATALALATDPARLAGLKRRLGQAKAEAAVFDSVRFCRTLEKAYESMVARHRQGLPPAAFSVTLPPG